MYQVHMLFESLREVEELHAFPVKPATSFKMVCPVKWNHGHAKPWQRTSVHFIA
jgi:hypothetical protein